MRKTLLLLASAALGVLLASGVAQLAPSEPASAAFPGQNGRIAFTSDRVITSGNADGSWEIYTMEPDGSGIKQLTHNSGEKLAQNPNFSPDGSKITYELLDTRTQNSDIYVMNSNGTKNIRLTKSKLPESDPAFDPGGKTIVYTGYSSTGEGANFEIFRINADGSGTPTNLTNNPGQDQDPAVSADGQIAFTSIRDDGDPLTDDGSSDIYTMNADGSNPTNLTPTAQNTQNFADFRPNYSPDGQQITFGSVREGGKAEIYKMNSDGTGPTKLTDNPMANNFNSAFSPDGTKIVFISDQYRDGNSSGGLEVYTMNADNGGNPTRLTFTGGPDAIGGFRDNDQPDWQPR